MKNKWTSLLLIAAAFLLISGCQDKTEVKDTVKEEPKGEKFIYTKYDLPVEQKAILGNKHAPHTIYLAFDYACPWCKKWMQEILPEIQKEFIESGQAKYISQPLSLLSEESLKLVAADYFVETNIPGKYFDYQLSVAAEAPKDHSNMSGNWGTDQYIESKINKFGLNYNDFLKQKDSFPDNLTLTRQFTREFALEFVPTIYVDGIKLAQYHDMNEMKKIMEGKIKEGDVIYIESNN
ncbi:DsbA family protein [Mesobacillus zeae]|uniref:DsbA family protein n=1 Tax=Mesobacillus zeae TaxID=1917180 RepID=UPI00300B76F9